MASGILFFEKNKIDLDYTSASITVTDATATDNGQSYVNYVRNRNNYSGWSTTGSNDAANSTLEINLGDSYDITDIILVDHNFKSYTVKYWNGSAWTNFSSTIAPTTNTDTTTNYNFTTVNTTKVQIIILGTMVADADKAISQIIITQRLGQFTTFPRIKKPEHDKSRRILKMISGKGKLLRNVGSFECSLEMTDVIDTTDLNLIEDLFDSYYGFLVWLCGGDESQFRTSRIGYRKKDLFLMNCKNNWEPTWMDGFYGRGTKVEIDLIEVI